MYLLSILFLIFSFNGALAYTPEPAEINPEPVVTKEKRDFKISCTLGTLYKPIDIIYIIRCYFPGFDFSNGNLKSAEIKYTDLTGANFFGADLRNAEFKETKLKGANFDYADLRGATLTDVDITGASFKGADLTGATITTKDLNTAE